MPRNERTRVAWAFLASGIWVMSGAAMADEPQPDEVETLITALTEIDRPGMGYSGSASGTAFLPLGRSNTHTILFGQRSHQSSEALKSLVKLGPAALPKLLEHLDDERPTGITLVHQAFMGALRIRQDEVPRGQQNLRDGDRKEYTVMVGDLCYVAVGQIVNRPYTAVRYQPTAIINVTSVPRLKELREELRKEWGNLTPEKHRDSLIRDLLDPGNGYIQNEASVRLAYYYPEALEAPALEQLSRPSYSPSAVHDLIRDRLYPAKTAAERKALVEGFVAEHGELAHDGIRWHLFGDLDTQEADEEGRLSSKLDPPYQARKCLIDLFGYAETVKSEDRPESEPLTEYAQARFVQTLLYDRSEKLDRALRDILAETDSYSMAKGCLDRLVGRGYDADIEAYLERGLLRLKEDARGYLLEYRAKLGWTWLHATVHLGIAEYVETAIKEEVPVDAMARDGRTALHLAAGEGKIAIVDLLLTAGADTGIKDGDGRLAVGLAAREDYARVVHLLVENGSEIPDVFVAATVGAVDRLKGLFGDDRGSANLRNEKGLTALHVAAREGHAGAVETLIAGGADVGGLDLRPAAALFSGDYSQGWTPLHIAAMAGESGTACVLLDHGAEVNAKDQRGQFTPLHYAAWGGDAEFVTLLLARDAERDVKDEQGRSPLDLAKEQGHEAVVKLLEK